VARQVDGIAVGAIAAGSLLAYAGIKGYSVPHAIQSLVQGQAPVVKANPITSVPGQQSGAPGNAGLLGAPGSGAAPGGGTSTQNQRLGQFMAAGYGWTGAEWTALNNIVEGESGWDNQIYNGGTVGGPYQPDKAYGIAQALSHGNNGAPYPQGNAGNPPGAGGTSSASAQISWLLSYIKQRYGTPSQAWAFHQANGWY
jgi:hypothetical protein